MDLRSIRVEFRIGVAETYDVIVPPREERAYTIFAQSEDRTGYARGTLATRTGLAAPTPPMDPRPLRTMADMGMGNMSMGGMDMGKGGHAATPMNHADVGSDAAAMSKNSMPGMDMGASGSMAGMSMDHGSMSGMDMSGGSGSMAGMDMGGGSNAGHLGTHGRVGRPGLTGNGGDSLAAKLNVSVQVDNVAMMPMTASTTPATGWRTTAGAS